MSVKISHILGIRTIDLEVNCDQIAKKKKKEEEEEEEKKKKKEGGGGRSKSHTFDTWHTHVYHVQQLIHT